jgi:tetratricopeptide (TPR) repeat protein
MAASRITLAVAAVLLFAGGRARAAEDELARAHFLLGEAAYQEGRYADAIKEFQASQAIDPRPALEYNIGMCQELLGDKPAAIAAFERYLATEKEVKERAAIEKRIARLKEELRTRRAAASGTGTGTGAGAGTGTGTGAGAGAGAGAATRAPAVAARPTPVYRKGWFWAVLVGSAAAVALGVGLGVGLGARGEDSFTNLTNVTLR